MSGDELTTSVPAGITILTQEEAKKFILFEETFGQGDFSADCEIFKATNGTVTYANGDWGNMAPKQGVLVEIYQPGASVEQDKLIASTVVYSGSELTVAQIKALALAGDIEAGKQVDKVFKDRECSAQEVTVKETISGDIKFYVTYEEKIAVTETFDVATNVTGESGTEFKSGKTTMYDGTLFKITTSQSQKYMKYIAADGSLQNGSLNDGGISIKTNAWLIATGSTREMLVTNKNTKAIQLTVYFTVSDSNMAKDSGYTLNNKANDLAVVVYKSDTEKGATVTTTTKAEVDTTNHIFKATFTVEGSQTIELNVDGNRLVLFGIYATDTPAS